MLALLSCTSASPAASAPCSATLAGEAGADLVLVGVGSCGTTLRLGLRVATGATDAPVWSDAATSPVRVDGAWQAHGSGATRTVTVTNTGKTPISLLGLEWSTAPSGVTLPVDRLLHNGYQSWSYTGMEAIPASLADDHGTAPHGATDQDALAEVAGVSWWWGAVSDANNAGIVLGADGGTVLKTYVAADGAGPARVRVVQGMTGDAITLAPNESRALDGLYVALGDVRANLDDYARHVATLHPRPAPAKAPLGGWGSWNMYYANITAEAMRQEAQLAGVTLRPLGLTDVLLDDGYEAHWGSWTASPAFGADLHTLASEQKAAGLRSAIWLAPLYVDMTDPLVTAHADWFVHDAGGALRTFDNFGPTYAALDVTQPDARAFVVAAVQSLRAAGFSTLKMDFLFAGALTGVRQKQITALESYALWMKTLREAVPDVHLVGCGAPMLPSVGWVDSMRIGPDVAYSVNPAPRYPFLAAEARHVAMRAMTDAWWALDPDVVLLRGTAIDDAEAWSVVVFSALAGGNYLLGDPQQAGDLRRSFALAPDVLAITRDGVAARPVDLTANMDPGPIPSPLLAGNRDTAVPHVWKKTSADPAHGALAVFGWELDDGYEAHVDLPDGAREILPPAAAGPTTQAPAGGARTVTVARHAARLFTW